VAIEDAELAKHVREFPMTTAFLNNEWVPLAEAKISALDRGFLFGDGIYEVIPVHHQKPVALNAHLTRLNSGLDEIGIVTGKDDHQWTSIIHDLIAKNANQDMPYQGLYLHVSRGADVRRHHSFPKNIAPTIFAFMFEIPAPPAHHMAEITPLKVGLSEDLRWRRCHIKSTSLLGNVLHFQQGNEEGLAETILHNQEGMVTEASACNVFMVKKGRVITPPLDNQLLPGITRQLVLKAIREKTDIPVEERFFTIEELMDADEVWLTSSTKEIAPVNQINGSVIGTGIVGNIWESAIRALNEVKFD
jgi:D-alanine transaminase